MSEDTVILYTILLFGSVVVDWLIYKVELIIASASADASADTSADMPEGRLIKLKILLKHSRML